MSDEPTKPNPEFNFDNMNVEDAPPIPLEFPMDPAIADIIGKAPNPKAGKRKWWQSKPKDEKKPTATRAKKPMPAMPTGGLKAPIMNIYMGLGLGFMPINPTLAKAFMESAEPCAEAWVEYAKVNPAVKRYLIGLCSASAAGTLIFAHLPILAAAVMAIPAVQKKQGEKFADMVEMFARQSAPQENEEK